MKIVFIDPKCPSPYDSEVLASRGLGGTEASVVRIARALSEAHDVTVVQHNRVEAREETPHLRFLAGAAAEQASVGADHVVFIQKAQNIGPQRRRSTARMWLWLHNFLGDEVPFFWQDHLRHRLGIICVSRTHAEHTHRHLRSHRMHVLSAGWLARGGVTWLHNPIDDTLAPLPGIVKDRHKLVFFSSPYKGIEQVIAAFRVVHARDPRFHLVVADPGYIRNFDVSLLDHPAIRRVGSLPHAAVMHHVQEALCVFYPQWKRPETFGLVYAEANAVGVPVLAHDFGAAREVLVASNPPIDARDIECVVDTLARWERGEVPLVQAQPMLALRQVVAQWTRFLTAPDAFLRSRPGPSA